MLSKVSVVVVVDCTAGKSLIYNKFYMMTIGGEFYLYE